MMGKKLSEMTLEELWQLFPIYLKEHQSCWKEWYSEEERLLKNVLPSTGRISHIGSTAVSSLWAKPIIDILVAVSKERDLLDYKDLIINAGYICMSQSENEMPQGKPSGLPQDSCIRLWGNKKKSSLVSYP